MIVDSNGFILLTLCLHGIDQLHKLEDIKCGATHIYGALGRHYTPHFSELSVGDHDLR